MTEVFCNTCGKGFKNPGSLASHRYKIHKTVKYKSYRNHKECNDNVKYEMSVSDRCKYKKEFKMYFTYIIERNRIVEGFIFVQCSKEF